MSTLTTSPAREDQYTAAFERLAIEEFADQPAWLRDARRSAMSRFAEMGFPTLHDEEWRFTPLAAIQELPYHPVLESASVGLARSHVDHASFGLTSGSCLVFIDGHYSPSFSTLRGVPTGVTIASLAALFANNATPFDKHFGQYARIDENPFTALNSALFLDGAFVHVPKGVVVSDPILLLYVSTQRETPFTTHPRNLIVAERESKATIIESYVSLGQPVHFTNAVTEIGLGENSSLQHCRVQRESRDAFHVATVEMHQKRSSNLLSHSIAIGGRLARTDIHARFEEEGGQAVLNGLYVGSGDQLIDHHTVIDHAKPHCESHEFYNGILDDRAKGVFNGKIFVRPDAQKTDAKQTSRALLLSEDAMVDAKPQLEIFADDVKCTHGSTVGQLDDEAIFYLRSRGIGVEAARRMLIAAFAGEILGRITVEPVRVDLEQALTARLAGKDLPHE